MSFAPIRTAGTWEPGALPALLVALVLLVLLLGMTAHVLAIATLM